jgi:hypothetical protein
MTQYATTPDDSARRPIGNAHPVKGDNRGTSTADRVALAAMFTVAILILVIVMFTYKSAAPPMAAVASVAMSSSVDLPLSGLGPPQTEQRAAVPSAEKEKEPGSAHRRRQAR